jgi:hypothetical protein
MDRDESALPPNGDLAAARQLDETSETAQLFLYAGNRLLFADGIVSDYDPEAANLLTERVLIFLDTIE